jgi:hypothetical protein
MSNIVYLSKKPLRELRRMQNIITGQQEVAYRNKHTYSLEVLRERENEVCSAISLKEFGE